MTKVAVYVRVSTYDQEKGIESQKQALREYLEGHGITGATWYVDRVSGATTKRPEFEKMQKAIFNGHVKTIVCWKLDRISRSFRNGVAILTDWIAKDVRVVSVAQQLDFTGPVGQMVAGILFALAEMERENIRENTKRGLCTARSKGKTLGRRPKVLASDVLPLLEKGHSIARIARELQCSRTAVRFAISVDIKK